MIKAHVSDQNVLQLTYHTAGILNYLFALNVIHVSVQSANFAQRNFIKKMIDHRYSTKHLKNVRLIFKRVSLQNST